MKGLSLLNYLKIYILNFKKNVVIDLNYDIFLFFILLNVFFYER